MAEADQLLRQARRHVERGQWAEVFHRLHDARRLLRDCEQSAIDHARAAGWSWPAVGRALGTSWQAAWQRYSPNSNRRRPRPKPPAAD